jgi:hypothetical protein
MLVFVACVKHPENSQSYEEVWRLLNKTLYSVCNQKDQDFRVIVVCDKKEKLLHHEELINQYTEFIEVGFPSHSAKVVDNFNRLGNLSPSLDDPSWWVRWKDQKDFKKTNLKEYLHIANVVLNMGSKLLIGILAAAKYNPDYVMFFDADDYVGNDISAYVNSHPGENGWIMAHGYKMAEKRIVPFYNRNSFCGTGNIYNHSLLMDLIGTAVSENSTQNELFEHVDSEFLITIGKHQKTRSYFESKGRSLLEYPFRSVVYYLWHKESSEYTRKIIRGELVNRRLNSSNKFGNFSLISSRFIDNFNILPNNSVKVFCLGLQKTGTTSVEWLLKDMGKQVATYYKNWDIEFVNKLKQGDYSELKRVAELFDAFQDAPWFLFYREFDSWYPGSKFILTIRDSRSWWKSFLYYFEKRSLSIFEYIYGYKNPVGNENNFIERYERHNREVIEYFKDRPEDLLVIDVSEENALHKISNFLGESSTFEKMPHINATQRIPLETERNKLLKNLKNIYKVKFNILPALKILASSAPPIIIGGSKESGTELMLSILSCHPNIHALRNVKLNFPERHPLSTDRSRIPNLKKIYGKSPINFTNLIYKLLQKRIRFSAKRWCGTSTLSVLAYEKILDHYGKNVRILNMVRDGRDVVTEPDREVMGNYAVPYERWVYDVTTGMKLEDHPQVLTIRYEDLEHNYEKTIMEIYNFIGEKNEEFSLHYPKRAKIITSKYWIGKWRQPKFSKIIDELERSPDAMNCLQHYGYSE